MNQNKISINKTLDPLIIKESENSDILYYDLDSPYMIMLETCREKEKTASIFRFSPNDYQSVFLTEKENDFSQKRPLHKHAFIEIMYVISGSVTNCVEDQRFTYEAGQCCVMNKNIAHCELFTGDYQVVFFSFSDSYMRDLLTEYARSDFISSDSGQMSILLQLFENSLNDSMQFDKTYLDCFPRIPSADILERLSVIFNFIINENLNQKPGASFFIKGAFSRFFDALSDPALFSINCVHSDTTGQEFLFEKISHIVKAKHGRCTREELSSQLHYNGEYLNRVVKKYTGETLLAYGQSIYLEEAKDLLVNTDKSISTIIQELGFSNRSHFYRLFEKKYGKSPAEYRKNRA